MKKAIDYQLEPGRHGLNYYKFFTPGLSPYKSKAKIIEALNLNMTVFMKDLIMNETFYWDETKNDWVLYNQTGAQAP